MENESLLQAFDAPEGYYGQVCICCALSADQIFMEEALERFTHSGRYSYDGAPNMFLMLDRMGTMLDARQMPGLVQLQAKHDSNIRVQHAKVALMQFGKSRCTSRLKLTSDTVWRLVVSTGNWTKESACHYIEMVWKSDFYTKDAEVNRQLLADLFSAYVFFAELRDSYVCNDALWKRAELLGECLMQFKEERGVQRMAPSRFISTVGGMSLMDAVVPQFRRDGIKRNFIQIGSGFYEKGKDTSKPEIIQRLDKILKPEKGPKFFSIRPMAKRIVVNRDSANRLAYWEKNFWDGWEMFDVKDPVKIKDTESKRNFLHAKYICLGNMRGEKYSDCKFYIGSGNLTRMGLLSAYGMTPNNRKGAGNIEAGIVVGVDSTSAKALLTCGNRIKNSDVLEKPDETEESKMPIPVCPLNAFELVGALLKPVWNAQEDIEDLETPCSVVTDAGESEISLFSEQAIAYPDSRPVYILIKWREFDYWIPVITENGTLPVPVLKMHSIDDLLESIAEFPDRQDVDDAEEDEGDEPKKKAASSSNFHDDVQQDVFPIQLSMKLVDGIARHNETITDDSIDDWIDFLEKHLDALPQSKVDELKRMKVNFLNVLTAKGFAPLQNERSRWNAFIKKMSEKWGMAEWIGLK